jgi:putative ABC transport system permease protein
MNLFSSLLSIVSISFKGIRYRLLTSALTMLSVALGVAMMIAVILVYSMVNSMFLQGAGTYQVIVGPKGSGIDLVLSAVYRIRPPIENVPWRFYQEFKEDPRIEACIPIAFGDYLQDHQGGFPVVGTIPQYFKYDYAPDEPFVIGDGESFLRGTFDAVVGSEVARFNGWKPGDSFQMVHSGTDATTSHVHEERFTVRGVLRPTGTPNDRTAFIHLDGFFAVSGHEKPVEEAISRIVKWYGESEEEVRARYADDLAQIAADEAAHANEEPGEHHHHHHAQTDLQKEVTALLVRTRASNDPLIGETQRSTYAQDIIAELKEGVGALGVNPHFEVQMLMDSLFGNIRLAMLVLTFLIIAVSGIGIFVSIYNSMSERKREIGIMRALGASRAAVLGIILSESVLLCVLGGLLGIVLAHGVVYIGAPLVGAQSGLVLNPLQFEPVELYVIPGMIALACVVGVLPAMTAYRTDVADALSHG